MPHHRYYEPNDSLTGSEPPNNAQLPQRPRPAVTPSSSYDDSPRRSSRRRESHGQERTHRDEVNTRRARDADRDRRRHRTPRDPEREARRARREERAAHDPDYAARRQQRRASKRAERRASRQIEQHEEKDRDADSTDHDREKYAAGGDDELAHRPEYPTPVQYPDGKPPRHLERGDSWQSSADGFTVDLESPDVDEKRYYHSGGSSAYSEVDYYRRGSRPDDRDHYRRRRERQYCCGFGRKCCIISTIITTLLLLILIIVVAVVVSRNKFHYSPSTAQVNETAAFTSGAATHTSVTNTSDGIGAGADNYTYYQGNATAMLALVPASKWVSFSSMWSANLATIQAACGILNYGANDSPTEIQDIYNAIQNRANASLIDHRLILAFILQESKGCVRVPNTKSSSGVKNTGLMQAHNGHEYSSKHASLSIQLMIQDGVQGTKSGEGIVQILDAYYGNPYAAARVYNSGYIPASGNLSEAAGATACYVSDVVNRLTGWVTATSTCPGS